MAGIISGNLCGSSPPPDRYYVFICFLLLIALVDIVGLGDIEN